MKLKNPLEPPESNYQKLLKEIKQLNIADLFKNDGVDFSVLCSNTKKYPILDDLLEECSRVDPFITNSRLLINSCIDYIKGLTNIKTIEILLKKGANPNFQYGNKFFLLAEIFNEEFNIFFNDDDYDSEFDENYKIIGDLLFENGYKFDYTIFYFDVGSISNLTEIEMGYMDYCIQKIPKDDVKNIIEDIVADEDQLYTEEYKEYLLMRFFQAHPGMLMSVIKK